MSDEAIPPEQVQDRLHALAGWSGDETGIQRHYQFSDFLRAMTFMQGCVEGIEERQHHPEWRNVYNNVWVTLKTHDAGDRVTEKDFDLAVFLDGKAEEFS